LQHIPFQEQNDFYIAPFLATTLDRCLNNFQATIFTCFLKSVARDNKCYSVGWNLQNLFDCAKSELIGLI